jgi:hypothetical protein
MKAATLCLALACLFAVPGRAGTLLVTNTNDNGSGSLRQALVDAHNGDTIDATALSGVITLTTGELLVDKTVAINGPGPHSLAVDGNAASAVLHVTAIGSVTISGLTIRNGQGGQTGFGGGIINAGTILTITDSTIIGNRAGFGAGIYNSGTLTITDSTVTDNIGPDIAGGSQAGGIYNTGILDVVNSTVSNNKASVSAALYNGSETLTISNSTVSGNQAQDYAGCMFNGGTLRIFNTTISNSARFLAINIINVGTIQIGNSILNGAAPGSVPNIFSSGTVTSFGYNVSSDGASGLLTGPGDQIFTDPMLGPLQDNGGATFTQELLAGSPAIDAGNPNFTPPPLFDQRGPGFNRVAKNRIDVGAFEVQGPTATPTPSVTPTPFVTPTASPVVTPRPIPTPRPHQTPAPRLRPRAGPYV